MKEDKILLDHENKLISVGLSIPKNLLLKFDNIIKERGYSSRSEGIRDSIRKYINYYDWMNNIKGQRVATIIMIYDINQRGLTTSINDYQSNYSKIINSSIRVYLDKSTCLEVIILRGDGMIIKSLSEELLSQKGVKYLKLTTISQLKE